MQLIDVDVLRTQMKELYEKRAEEANMTGDRAICVTWKDAVILIKDAPIVDAAPVVHGKWEVTPVYIKCSECGESFMLIPQDYCPHCGARMDKE